MNDDDLLLPNAGPERVGEILNCLERGSAVRCDLPGGGTSTGRCRSSA
jgi:hypothetical protein